MLLLSTTVAQESLGKEDSAMRAHPMMGATIGGACQALGSRLATGSQHQEKSTSTETTADIINVRNQTTIFIRGGESQIHDRCYENKTLENSGSLSRWFYCDLNAQRFKPANEAFA
jgi:hypothetical protein